MKDFADNNFRFHENERKLSKQVENTVGKGEIARYEQFLLFPQCFQKACFPGVSKGVIVWEWVKECAGDKFKNDTNMLECSDWIENVQKGVMLNNSIFYSSQCFQKLSFSGLLKLRPV